MSSSLEKSAILLKTYTGESIKVLGTIYLNARYGNQKEVLTIHVVDRDGPDLMGRDWLSHFDIISLCEVNHVTKPLQAMLDKHSAVFDKDLRCMKGVEVTLEVKSEVEPKNFKPRSVAYILKQKVADKLDRLCNLCNLGIISPVKTAKWAIPIVPVVKKDGTIRICGDFKSTVNQATHIETYPLARVEELFSNLAGGKYFSKLGMSSAYLQFPLAELSK